jgi:hypothetical protein
MRTVSRETKKKGNEHNWMLIFGVEGNATTNDLWSALSKASGQDVHGFMVSLPLIFKASSI